MKTRILPLLSAVFLLLFLFAGCAGTEAEYRDVTFFAMDTYVTVRLARDGVPEDVLAAAADACEQRVAALEKVLSAHDPDSELSALNASRKTDARVSDALAAALTAALDAAQMTGGAYDFTLGALSSLWNITGGGPVPARADVDAALRHTGYEKVTADGNTVTRSDAELQLDLGGIGKGIAAEELVQYLEGTEIPYGLVSVGGTIGVFGNKPDGTPYKIGIRDPDDPNGVVGYFHLYEGFVAVSGDYERYFEENGIRYHHILDPSDGYPADSGLREAAVYCKSGAAADAFSTALFVMGTDAAMELYERAGGFEAVFVSDGAVDVTRGADVEITIRK
ncbi:MAG: FAD:protein FMN transferase [Eubacteriales bacterium]